MSDYKRQHPMMILVQFIKHIKSLVLPVIFGVFISVLSGDEGGDGSPIFMYIILAILGITLIHDILGWLFYRYALKDNALNVKSGIVIKKRRHIKKERVQATSLEAGIVLRVLGLLSLRVETAGSKTESEFQLAGLKPADAKRIQTFLEDDTQVADTPTADTTYELDNKMLLIAGLTSGGIGFVFSIVGFIFSQAIIFIPDHWLDRFYDSVLALSVILIVILVAVIFIISWVI